LVSDWLKASIGEKPPSSLSALPDRTKIRHLNATRPRSAYADWDCPQMPQAGQLVGGTLGNYMHAGGHGTIPSDWEVFLRFMATHLQPAK
jgi:hypothetical protein